jgi:hypothetical protein
MSPLKNIELLDPVGVDGIATFSVLFVAVVLLIAAGQGPKQRG